MALKVLIVLAALGVAWQVVTGVSGAGLLVDDFDEELNEVDGILVHAERSLKEGTKDQRQVLYSETSRLQQQFYPVETNILQDQTTIAVSEEATQTLLEYENLLGTPSGYSVPIHRKDMPDTAAYYEIHTNESTWVIISAGLASSDLRMLQLGEELPSPTMRLDEVAKKIGEECSKYFMLNSDGFMFCENKDGTLVGTTIDPSLIHQYCGNNTDEVSMLKEVNRQACDSLEDFNSEWEEYGRQLDEDGDTVDYKFIRKEDYSSIYGSETYERALTPGMGIRLNVGESRYDILVRYISSSDNNTEESNKIGQRKLCEILIDACEGDNQYIPQHKVKTSSFGARYVEIRMEIDYEYVYKVLEGEEMSFEVVVTSNDGKPTISAFGIDLSAEIPDPDQEGATSLPPGYRDTDEDDAERQKRAWYEYQSWYAGTWCIPYLSLFPRYWQHWVSRKCWSGCGPVAWAMVFGYYDRAAHAGHNPALQALFRCGWDGTSGSDSCIAPSSLNTKMRRYVEKLRYILETFCLFNSGATWQWRMDDIECFFKGRGGHSVSLLKTDGLVGFYSNSIRDWASARIRYNKLPVVIGRRVGGLFSQHYPVATCYNYVSYKWRRCFKFLILTICGPWRTQVNRYWRLQMGWGGYGDGYYPAKAFMAAVAYP